MEKSTRLELEMAAHLHSTFVTLTYADAPQMQGPLLPGQVRPGPTLIRKDLSDWLKRLRERYHRENENSLPLRFFACGEYGDVNQRPHYHVILFGYKGCRYGRSRYEDGRTLDCCYSCDLVRDTWDRGIVQCEPVAGAHLRYIAGYVLKKMTSKHDRRLAGRAPEFSGGSLRQGGMGIGAVPELARRSLKQNYDVISQVPLHNGKRGNIGRYLKRKIRQHLDPSSDGSAPDYVQKDAEAKMLPLLKAARQDKENFTLKKQIQERSKTAIASMKYRETLNSRKKGNL